MTQKSVIFDFGNVLIKWEPHVALADVLPDPDPEQAHEHLAEIGFFAWNLEQDRGRSMAEGLAVAAKDHPDDYAIFATYVEKIALAHQTPIYGTCEIIRELHVAGVPLFGLSNASLEAIEAVRGCIPEIGLMKDVLISAAEKLLKPDAEIYTRLMGRNGLSPENCIFIDDSAANVAGAKAVGIDAILFEDAAGLAGQLQQRGLLA